MQHLYDSLHLDTLGPKIVPKVVVREWTQRLDYDTIATCNNSATATTTLARRSRGNHGVFNTIFLPDRRVS